MAHQDTSPRTRNRAVIGSVAALAVALTACAHHQPDPPHPPHQPDPTGADCAAFEKIIDEPTLVVGALELRDCPAQRALADEVFAGWVDIPAQTLPASARVSALDREVTLVALGPGPGDADLWFLRLDFATTAEATAWFNTTAPAAEPGARPLTTYAPPEVWPVHPDHAPDGEDTTPPAWWPTVGTPGDAIVLQRPDPFEPCITPNASGQLWFHAGPTVWVHRWHREHYGGCGG